MPTPGGPLKWPDGGGTTVLSGGLYLDGAFFKGGKTHPPWNWAQRMAGSVLSTMGGTDIFQRRGVGGDQPVNLFRVDLDFRFTVNFEEDFRTFQRAASKSEPVEAWLDLPFFDFWRIASANAGQTIWKTSRRLPYSITGITHGTRPPRAWIDSTEQTIVTSPGPAAGEVFVPTTGGYADIETPSGIAGTYLELQYNAVMLAVVSDVREEYRETNRLRFRARLAELRANTFTSGAAA